MTNTLKKFHVGYLWKPFTGLLFGSLIGAGACAAQNNPNPSQEWHETTAGRAAQEFLLAHNAGDEAAYIKYTQTWRHPDWHAAEPLEARVEMFVGISAFAGTIEVAEGRAHSDHLVELVGYASGLDSWVKLVFELGESAPPYIVKYEMLPSGPPEVVFAEEVQWQSLAELANIAGEEAGVPGLSVAVLRVGKTAENGQFGVQTLGEEVLVETFDAFHIGSVTKTFTATLAGILVAEGTLGWSTTVGSLIPEAKGGFYENVTLEDLLQHRGGIRPYTDDEVDQFPDFSGKNLSPENQRAQFLANVLAHDPVGDFKAASYSNAGYALAGHMLELATGKPFEKLMQEKILDTLGLATCRFGWPQDITPKAPSGHYGKPGELVLLNNLENPREPYLNPPGGLSCSAEDLAALGLWHLKAMEGVEDLGLTQETVLRLKTPINTGDGIASGWIIDRFLNGAPVMFHSGSAGPFYAKLAVFPDQKMAVAVLMNMGSGGEGLADRLLREIVSKEMDSR